MGTRKLQVFVSSTYSDLVDVRLAAMEAILAAGHIPAAMEQFAPGDETAWAKIKRWVQQSDGYLLILGGRYGSREPQSGRGYVELEYDYALELGKPFVSLVASDAALKARAKRQPLDLETSDPDYKSFKAKVKHQHCAFWDNIDQVKANIYHKLPHWAEREELVGWVRRDQFPVLEASNTISPHPYRRIVEVDQDDLHPRPIAFDVAHSQGRIHRAVHVEIYSAIRDKTLVLRRNESQRRLELVGGHVDWLDSAGREETYRECCLRELKEELSLRENVPWLCEADIDEELRNSLEEVRKCFNRAKSAHRNNAEHVQIFRLNWPEAWGDPALPWWKWNEEVVAAYWLSRADLFSQGLQSDMVNTALRMFIERSAEKGAAEVGRNR